MSIEFFTQWFAAHPNLSLLLVMLIALTESLIVVGIVVPGAAMMVAAGVLVGLGTLEFWPVFYAAVIGAILGDGISFWIGFHYQQQLKTLWPFRRYPQWLAQVERYFSKHGGKSVLFGRFVGPVRPFVPAVAGMMGMPRRRFYLINICSAFAWAPAYLLPGVVFGASLNLASEVAARLVLFILLSAFFVFVLFWFVKTLHQWLAPQLSTIANKLLQWGQGHPVLGSVCRTLLDESEADQKSLIKLGLWFLLLAAALLVLHQLLLASAFSHLNQQIAVIIQQLLYPWAQPIFGFMVKLSQPFALAVFLIICLSWLILSQQYRVIKYWLSSQLLFTLTLLLFGLFSLAETITDSAALSAQLAYLAVFYGFVLLILAHQLSPSLRWLVYALSLLLVKLTTLALVYYQLSTLTQAALMMSLASLWLGLSLISYYRHANGQTKNLKEMSAVAFLAVFITMLFSPTPTPTVPEQTLNNIDSSAWWQGEINIEAGQPKNDQLNIQWQGSLAEIRQQLSAAGWVEAPALTYQNVLKWLAPADYPLVDRPLLPKIYQGKSAALTMINSANDKPIVLRLWHSGYRAEQPIWLGAVYELKAKNILSATVAISSDQLALSQHQLTQRLFADNSAHITSKQGVMLIRD
jgi:undecaprenyl-diphosphatase